MGKSVNTHIPAHCQLRRVSQNAKEVRICLALEGVNVNVASALATRREIGGFMAKRARVMIAAAKTWTEWSAEVNNSHSLLLLHATCFTCLPYSTYPF